MPKQSNISQSRGLKVNIIQKFIKRPKKTTKTPLRKPNFRFYLYCSTLALICQVLLASFCPFFSTNSVSAATGNVNNFYIKDFTADYYLTRDANGASRLFVVEEITAVFPNYNQNHGFTRVIPFTNNDGKNLTMETGDTIYLNVERNGQEEEVSKVEIGDGCFIVYIGDTDHYVTGEQTYLLEYEFTNPIMDFGEWQELYWDANGNDWKQRFDKITANVHLDEDILDNFTGATSCYVGSYGTSGEAAQQRCQTSEIEDGVRFTASKLSPRETLTFDLEFDANTFALPPKHYDFRFVLMLIGEILAGAGITILIVLALRSTANKRKFYRDLFVKPEYTPPKGFTVGEMATNYIGKGGKDDSKVATLLELAISHKIELIKTEASGFLGSKKTQWKVRIRSTDLTQWQVVVLKILAGSKAGLKQGQEITIETRSSTPELISLNKKFVDYINASLEEKGLAENPSETKSKSGTKAKKPKNWPGILGAAVAVWTIAWLACIVLALTETPSYITVLGGWPLFVIFLIIAIAMTIVVFVITLKTSKYATITQKGLEYSKYLEGLRLYISMAEAERLNFMQSVKGADTSHTGIVKLYEKLLPYAAFFKLEKTWINEMGKYYEFDDVSAPSWYIGVGAFSAAEFSAALSAASTSAANSISYSSASNSSSGFSGGGGGGFAGGGGGGGGGGGW